MKVLSKILFASYLLILLWLVLFKFSFDISSVLDHYTRNLNFIPFAASSRGSIREMTYNFLVFIPFGLSLSVNLKPTSFWRRLALIFAFSLTVELVQFILAIGITDATDIITNTAGGLLGLLLHDVSRRYFGREKTDRYSVITCTLALLVVILFLGLLRTHGVQFQSAPGAAKHERIRTTTPPIDGQP